MSDEAKLTELVLKRIAGMGELFPGAGVDPTEVVIDLNLMNRSTCEYNKTTHCGNSIIAIQLRQLWQFKLFPLNTYPAYLKCVRGNLCS